MALTEAGRRGRHRRRVPGVAPAHRARPRPPAWPTPRPRNASPTGPIWPRSSPPRSTNATGAAGPAGCIEARFPRLKRLEDFDLAAAPGINPATLAALADGAWIDAGEPVVPDRRLRHRQNPTCSSASGSPPAKPGRRVRYVTCAALVNELAEAADDRVLSKVVGRYGRLDLLAGRRTRLRQRRSPRRRAVVPGPDRTRGTGIGRACAATTPSASGAPPSPIPAWPPRSSTASPSTPTSSRPAPTATGSACPGQEEEVVSRRRRRAANASPDHVQHRSRP